MEALYSNRYRLHPAVFYRCYDDLVVVYHTGRQAVLTLNKSAGDILDFFRTYASMDELIDSIARNYESQNIMSFKDYIECFVSELIEKDILIVEYKQKEVYDNLESEISSHLSVEKPLYTVTIELTYKCNEKCRHCYIVDENRKELSTDEIKRILDELAEMGVFSLVFTGGEVFLRKDAFEILEYAYANGFLFEIFTNGTLINGNDYIRLKRLWPKCVHFSLYSYQQDKHDSITRVKGSFQKTLRSIKACRDIGIPVNIKTPLFAETYKDIHGLVALANSLRASIELGDNITPKKNGDLSPTKMKADDEDHTYIDKAISELIEKSYTGSIAAKDRICGAGERSISINPYGDVYPCSMLQLCIGNVTKESLRDIWTDSKQLKLWQSQNHHQNKRGCEGCELLDRCIFCPGEAMMRTGDPLAKYDEACQKTKRAIEKEKVELQGGGELK